MIPYDNSLIIAWNIAIIILKAFSGLFCLVLATFRNEENLLRNIDIISSVLESIFTVDFVLCFFKEFLGPDISSTGDKPYSTVAEIT